MAAYNPKDFYYKKAKSENYAARSVFKLEEIQKKHRILKPGMRVLDLGCAPGSWSQYTSTVIGDSGFILGLDLSPVGFTLANAKFLEADAFDSALLQKNMEELGLKLFDVVLSDMAPKTIGIRMADQERSIVVSREALRIASEFVAPGGHFVVKIFQGGEIKNFQLEAKEFFEQVHIERPKSVRKESFELYVVCLKRRRTPK